MSYVLFREFVPFEEVNLKADWSPPPPLFSFFYWLNCIHTRLYLDVSFSGKLDLCLSLLQQKYPQQKYRINKTKTGILYNVMKNVFIQS